MVRSDYTGDTHQSAPAVYAPALKGSKGTVEPATEWLSSKMLRCIYKYDFKTIIDWKNN